MGLATRGLGGGNLVTSGMGGYTEAVLRFLRLDRLSRYALNPAPAQVATGVSVKRIRQSSDVHIIISET